MSDVVKAQVLAVLQEERNDVQLQGDLVKILLEYLVGTLAVVEVAKDMPQSVDEWVAAAEGAYEEEGKAIPKPFVMRLKRWLVGLEGHAKGSPPPPTPKPMGGGVEVPGALALVAAEIGVTPAAIQDDFDEYSVTRHTRDKAFSDMKAQGMLLTRIYGLAMALESGKVHATAELAGSVYAQDVRATTLIKDLRKAKIPLLSRALEDKDLPAVISHLNALMRDFASQGLMHEAAVLSGWFQEWSQMFQGEAKLAVAYLVEYFRVYAGRGLPTPFDYGIMFRVQKSLGGVNGSEVEEVKKELKALKGTVNNLQEQCASLKKKGESTARSIEGLRQSGPPPRDLDRFKNVTCDHCGEKGHIARFCPNKDKPPKGKTKGADEDDE